MARRPGRDKKQNQQPRTTPCGSCAGVPPPAVCDLCVRRRVSALSLVMMVDALPPTRSECMSCHGFHRHCERNECKIHANRPRISRELAAESAAKQLRNSRKLARNSRETANRALIGYTIAQPQPSTTHHIRNHKQHGWPQPPDSFPDPPRRTDNSNKSI
eukprot:832454-Prymnesium_polylepis.3